MLKLCVKIGWKLHRAAMSKLTLVRRGFEGIKISGDKDLKSTGTPFPPCVSHNAKSEKQLLCSSFLGSKLGGRGSPILGEGLPPDCTFTLSRRDYVQCGLTNETMLQITTIKCNCSKTYNSLYFFLQQLHVNGVIKSAV